MYTTGVIYSHAGDEWTDGHPYQGGPEYHATPAQTAEVAANLRRVGYTVTVITRTSTRLALSSRTAEGVEIVFGTPISTAYRVATHAEQRSYQRGHESLADYQARLAAGA